MLFGVLRINWKYTCINPIFAQVIVAGIIDYGALKKSLMSSYPSLQLSDEYIYEQVKRTILEKTTQIIDKAAKYESIPISVENELVEISKEDIVEVSFGLQFKSMEHFNRFLKSLNTE